MLPTVVDAHLHVWDLDRAEYPWLGPDYGDLHRSIGLPEILPRMRAARVTAAVLVQAADNAEDTAHMLELAAARPEIAGVVAWVPLDRPAEAEALLDQLRGNDNVVGIRNLIHDQPDPDWILRPDVDRGLDLVARSGLPFDLVAVLPRHLEHVPTLRQRHPDLRLVIDHLAKPPVGQDDWQPWRGLITKAALYPDVYAKVSGLYPHHRTLTDWRAADLRPVVHEALELFGPQRLMFGSDWPISEMAGGYEKVWDALSTVIGELSTDEQQRILAGTAREFYGLNV